MPLRELYRFRVELLASSVLRTSYRVRDRTCDCAYRWTYCLVTILTCQRAAPQIITQGQSMIQARRSGVHCSSTRCTTHGSTPGHSSACALPRCLYFVPLLTVTALGLFFRGKPPKWNPQPKPAKRQCANEHFVPMGCHKCWFWNQRTWKHMKRYCPEVNVMKQIRAEYRVGVEFTGWPVRSLLFRARHARALRPDSNRRHSALHRRNTDACNWVTSRPCEQTRPRPTPIRGPALADARFLPFDMQQGRCTGKCDLATPRSFERTTLGRYHK